MMRFAKTMALGAAALVTLAAPPALAQRLGATAPQTSMTLADGGSLSLADLRGDPVILEWADASCPTHAKFYGSGQMGTLQRRLTAQGATWITLYRGERPAGGAPSYMVDDSGGDLAAAFGVRTSPMVVLLDEDGTVRYRGAIDSVPSDDPKDLARGENYLVTATRAILRGQDIVTSQTRAYGCPF